MMNKETMTFCLDSVLHDIVNTSTAILFRSRLKHLFKLTDIQEKILHQSYKSDFLLSKHLNISIKLVRSYHKELNEMMTSDKGKKIINEAYELTTAAINNTDKTTNMPKQQEKKPAIITPSMAKRDKLTNQLRVQDDIMNSASAEYFNIEKQIDDIIPWKPKYGETFFTVPYFEQDPDAPLSPQWTRQMQFDDSARLYKMGLVFKSPEGANIMYRSICAYLFLRNLAMDLNQGKPAQFYIRLIPGKTKEERSFKVVRLHGRLNIIGVIGFTRKVDAEKVLKHYNQEVCLVGDFISIL